ncbi:MAG: hypothetical protein ACJ77K_05520 [Bacteroidia bacterium]
MKRAGLIMIVSGIVLGFCSIFDLFGAKHLPIPLTVTVMIISIASAFSGPALLVFPLSLERRKRIANRWFFISLFFIGIGIASAYLHLPGARIEVIFGSLIICFFYGAIILKNKFEKWKLYARSSFDAFSLSVFDFAGVGCLVLGFLFRFQHWPGAEVIGTIGVVVLAVGLLAWNQKFKKEVITRKETEDKLRDSLEQIESQKHQLEEKQKEIIDSITYAKRIQVSLMPTEKHIQNTLRRMVKNK